MLFVLMILTIVLFFYPLGTKTPHIYTFLYTETEMSK